MRALDMLGTTLAFLLALVAPSPSAPLEGGVGQAVVVAKARLAAVQSRVEPRRLATRDPVEALRADLERSLGAIDWRREGIAAPVELSAVLADAESSAGRDRARASATVEVVISEPRGAMLAVVRASARGEDLPGARVSLEREVLSEAARRTSSSIPDAIRRARKARGGRRR